MSDDGRTTDDGQTLVPCGQCGRLYTFFELAETIEEYLCEYCASGIDPDDPDDDCHDYDCEGEW